MPHTLRLFLLWTYTKTYLGIGDTFLPNSTAPKLSVCSPPQLPIQLQDLSADVNADSLLVRSDLRRWYRAANHSIKRWDDRAKEWRHSSLWVRLKGPNWAISPSPQREPLITCKIQSRPCIICKILCWYCKWGLIAAQAPLSFIMYICKLW